MTDSATSKYTPLYREHQTRGARMIPFGGWMMPLQYEGIICEYTQCRTLTALFDTCHMGIFFIEGDCQSTGFETLVTQRLWDLPLKTGRYGFLLNNQGGVMDDLIVFRLAEDQWMIVVNAATIEKDAGHILNHLKIPASLRAMSSQWGKLDLQGPLARDILKEFSPGIEKLDYYAIDYFHLLGEYVLISRTGYTGELGYEIFFPREKIGFLWQELIRHPSVKPAGLGARDMLRLEMGYSLYGHEIDEGISPLEAGLGRFVDFEKNFIGKDALLRQKVSGLTRKLIGIISDDRRSPRPGQNIYTANIDEIGTVTSGSFSPHLQRGIGLGYVRLPHGQKEDKINFGMAPSVIPARVSSRMFYQKPTCKH